MPSYQHSPRSKCHQAIGASVSGACHGGQQGLWAASATSPPPSLGLNVLLVPWRPSQKEEQGREDGEGQSGEQSV